MAEKKTRKQNSSPSPAQLRARRKFAAMAKARAKAARAAKRAAAGRGKASARRRNSYDHQYSPAYSGLLRRFAEHAERRETTAVLKDREYKSTLAGQIARELDRGLKTAQAKLSLVRAGVPRAQAVGLVNLAQKIHQHRVAKGSDTQGAITRSVARHRAKTAKRRNAEHRDAQHPIEVSHHYRKGPKGYKTPWQRAHEAGQRQLFKVKNPSPAAIKAHIKKLEQERRHLTKRIRQEWDELERYGSLWPKYPEGSALYRGYMASARKAKHQAQRLEAQAQDVDRMLERAYGALEQAQPHRNPSPAAKAKRHFESFRGRPSLQTDNVRAPRGTPKDVAALGKLRKLKLGDGTVLKFKKGPSAPFAARDNRGKMHIVGGNYRINTGRRRRNPDGGVDFGEIAVIEYEADKPHLTGDDKEVLWFHHYGEEGGERPHLVVDGEGLGHIEGGDYTIAPEGVRD
jgi:hypothetical protein